jgi:hypothetical protein
MLVEIARMRSRGSKFEIKVFVMSSSNFRRSLSRCVSGLALGDSWDLNDWLDNESASLHPLRQVPHKFAREFRVRLSVLIVVWMQYLKVDPVLDSLRSQRASKI